MRCRPGYLALAALASAWAIGGAAAAPVEMEPYLMVRSLQLVQDRIAVGDHAAIPMQRKLLEMIDKRLREASAAELMQPKNMNYLMIYAMSGGNPETLRMLSRRLHVSEREGKLLAGIVSYLNGAAKTAALTLRDVEPMDESIEVGAFLALVRGSVVSMEDPASALKLFDQARLLAPGTLVEEAALRRSVGLAATLGDAARFRRLSEQFVRSYLRSPYASQFADSFVNGVLALHDKLKLSEVDEIVGMMTEEQRKVIYLRIARRAAIDGLVDLSNEASRRAGGGEGEGEGKEAEIGDPRVLLYTALTEITTAPIEEIRERLGRIDRSKLSPGDRDLLDAVMAVNSAIMRAPEETGVPQEAEEEMPTVIEAPAPLVRRETAHHDPDIPETEPDYSVEEAVGVPAKLAEIPQAVSGDATAEAAIPSVDPTDALISVGRSRLAEIDALLEGAAE